MKKLFRVFTIAFLYNCICSCNGSGGGNTNPPNDSIPTNVSANTDSLEICEGIDNTDLCNGAGGIANIIIETSKAQTLFNNFNTIFKTEGGKPINAFEPVYWLDNCTVEGIATFLKTQKDPATGKALDGIRIFFGCETKDNPKYGTDPYKRQTTINIFPTYFEKATAPNISDHKTSKQKITITGICSSPYLQDYNTADLQNKEFEKIYRKGGIKDSLSKSVWIDACVIYTLVKLLKLPKANIDGVNINMAAYDNSYPRLSRLKDNQTTVILVPTRLNGTKHENFWDIIECINKKIEKMGLLPSGGFNHGELCPNNCY
ncbi:MAG: hypothetical protein R2765_01430 [Ferruginibacter sp.]|nr:hypothetical protein [Bacteroidota bacterium]MBX2918332.1 hypothetical protein [Ferruginibacter sp.]MCB0709034.1 hypothetical protein [Chitinophagaceae bacterium]MCC7378264.1 hypothetical protein [Chitinophagaceae bacterium]